MDVANKSNQVTARTAPSAAPTTPASSPATAPAGASYATGRAATQPAPAGAAPPPASGADAEVVTTAIAAGQRNVNILTDKVFHARHPELAGQRVAAGSTLAREWTSLRDTVVKPQLQAAAASAASNSAGAAPSDGSAAAPPPAPPPAAAAPATPPPSAAPAPAAPPAAQAPSMLEQASAAASAGVDAAVGSAKAAASSAWNWLTGGTSSAESSAAGGTTTAPAGTEGGGVQQPPASGGDAATAGPAVADAPVAPDPAADELKTLMANERLDPDQIKHARELISKLPADQQGAAFEALQTKNEYHSQRDNASTADDATQDNMCNLTSLAMCLEYQGIKNPKVLDGKVYEQFEDYLEALRIKEKMGPRTESGTLKKVAAHFGIAGWTPLWSGAGKSTTRDEWTAWNAAHLATGKSIIMSIKGHIVRVQGVGEGGLVVDDPYGVVKLQKASAADYYYKDESGATKAKGGRVASSYSTKQGAQVNDKGSADNKGEDNVWPWADVEAHAMWWAVAMG